MGTNQMRVLSDDQIDSYREVVSCQLIESIVIITLEKDVELP